MPFMHRSKFCVTFSIRFIFCCCFLFSSVTFCYSVLALDETLTGALYCIINVWNLHQNTRRRRNCLRFIKRFVSINSLLPSRKIQLYARNNMPSDSIHLLTSFRHKMKRISIFSRRLLFIYFLSLIQYINIHKVGILCTQKENDFFLC